MQTLKIGFVGTGVMGGSMAGHLLGAGHELWVHNRTRQKATTLLERGARYAETLAELAHGCDVVITMVSLPSDVEQVYFAPGGLLSAARAGSLLIDMTTSSPELARRIAAESSARGVQSLDAPVSGGDVGAREARLSIMVGGETAVFERALPLFQLMGENIVLQGSAGAGQLTKMCNQIAVCSTMVACCEAMAYARGVGLSPEKVLTSIQSGAAGSWSLSNLMPRALAGDFAPGFFVEHFVKDLRIASESAQESEVTLPGLELGKRLYEQLEAEGHGRLGTQALLAKYLRTPATGEEPAEGEPG